MPQAGGIYRIDPPPVQRGPFAPIPVQGDQPPRYSPAQYYQLIEAWRPPPPQPWQKPLTIAPLTLTYGNSPPPYSTANQNAILETWIPPDPAPQRDRRYIAPLTLTYGNEPPRRTNAQFFSIWSTWPPAFEWQPLQRQTTVPIPAQGDQPSRFSSPNQHVILRSWLPGDPQQQRRPGLVPIPAAVVADSPIPQSLRAIMQVIVAAWAPPDPPSQTGPHYNTTFPPPSAVAPDPYRPHRADESDSRRSRVDEGEARRGRVDEGDSRRKRTDEAV